MEIEDATIEELVKGHRDIYAYYQCLFCAESFDKEEIFNTGNRFITARKMIERHIQEAHGSPFQAIMELDKKLTGLSNVQAEMMSHFFEGKSDSETVAASSVNSVSTVRQHRFKLREKERQAKLFIALMELLKEKDKYMVHKGARQVDERYGIEQEEREKVLKAYFKDGLDGPIETIPSKEKKKLIVLQHIVTKFEKGHSYNEKEVNAILKEINADFVSLRRHLIEYGFMDRNNEGSTYWVK